MLPVSIIAGLVGWVFGYFVERIIKYLKKGNPLQNKEVYQSGLLLSFIVFGAAIFIPLKLQLDWNSYNSPRIIIDTGLIQKVSFDSYTKNKSKNEETPFTINFGQSEKGKQLSWNNKTFKIKFDEHGFVIFDDTEKPFIKRRLEGYDYIREIICLPLNMSDSSESLLVVFTDLRATSKNSILHIFSPNGECVFQELVKDVCSVYLGYGLSSEETVLVLEYYNSEKNVYKLRKIERQDTI
jgi:hypothetical protein